MQGIYFIYARDTLVYIGKTTNIKKRLASHTSMHSGRGYKFLEVPNLSDMAILELVYIDKLKPTENSQDKFKSTGTLGIAVPAYTHLPMLYLSTTITSRDEYMAQIPQRELTEAMKDLSNGAYKLLMYYYSRNDGWVFIDENIASAISSSVRQVKKFRKELVDEKYLLIQKGQVDVYFIGRMAVHQFITDTYPDNIVEAVSPLITRGK